MQRLQHSLHFEKSRKKEHLREVASMGQTVAPFEGGDEGLDTRAADNDIKENESAGTMGSAPTWRTLMAWILLAHALYDSIIGHGPHFVAR
jgi:hypothetical protein